MNSATSLLSTHTHIYICNSAVSIILDRNDTLNGECRILAIPGPYQTFAEGFWTPTLYLSTLLLSIQLLGPSSKNRSVITISINSSAAAAAESIIPCPHPLHYLTSSLPSWVVTHHPQTHSPVGSKHTRKLYRMYSVTQRISFLRTVKTEN